MPGSSEKDRSQKSPTLRIRHTPCDNRTIDHRRVHESSQISRFVFYNAVRLHERAGITTLSKEASKPKISRRSIALKRAPKQATKRTAATRLWGWGSRAGSGVALPYTFYNDEDGCQAKETARLYESGMLW